MKPQPPSKVLNFIKKRNAQGIGVTQIKKELADKHGHLIVCRTIYNYLEKMQIDMTRKTLLLEQYKDSVIKAYTEDNNTMRAIAKRFKVSQPTVAIALRRWGIPIKSRLQSRFKIRKPKKTSQGYILISVPPEHWWLLRSNKTSMVEHRYKMSVHLNRKLLPNENVHHINGDRTDNRLENLELWSSSQPPGQRASDKLKWAKEIINQYEKDVLNGKI